MAPEQQEKLIMLKANETINNKLHRTGRIWTLCALIIMAMIPILFGIVLHATPDWGLFFACMALLIYYLPIQVAEVVTYSYMLGINGTYLAFITGNLSNLKIPCVINAVNIVGTEVGTEEHELACTISIAVSSIVTVVIIAIGVIALAVSPLAEILASPGAAFLKPAFGTVAFALFGALGGKYLIKNFKVAIVPFLVMTAAAIGLLYFDKVKIANPAIFMFIGIILCCLISLGAQMKKKKKAQQLQQNAANMIGEETENAFNDSISSLENDDNHGTK